MLTDEEVLHYVVPSLVRQVSEAIADIEALTRMADRSPCFTDITDLCELQWTLCTFQSDRDYDKLQKYISDNFAFVGIFTLRCPPLPPSQFEASRYAGR